MGLADNGNNGPNVFLKVNKGEQKSFRLLIIPGDEKYGDIWEKWHHSVAEPPPPGQDRGGKFYGYERCLGRGVCPMCVDRNRWPVTLRKACNIWNYDESRIMVFMQGPMAWNQIIQQLNTHVTMLNRQAAAQGQPEQWNVFNVTAVVDFFISKSQNNQYTVTSGISQVPVQYDPANLIDIDSLPDVASRTPEQLLEIMRNANTPNGGQQQYGMQAQGGLGAYGQPPQMPSMGGMPQMPGAPQMPYQTPSVPGAPVAPIAPPAPPAYGIPPASMGVPPMPSTMAPAPVMQPSTTAVPQPVMQPSVSISSPMMPGMPQPTVPPSAPTQSLTMDDARNIMCSFGKYSGKTLGEIAQADPAYFTSFLNTGGAKIQEGIVKNAIAMIAADITTKSAAVNTEANNEVANAMAAPAQGETIESKLGRVNDAISQGKIQWDTMSQALLAVGNGKTALNTLTSDELDAFMAKVGI